MFMLIIIIFCFVTIFGGLGLLKFLRVQKERKERKVVLEKRMEHRIQTNKHKSPQEIHPNDIGMTRFVFIYINQLCLGIIASGFHDGF